jgi:hypothetical protein
MDPIEESGISTNFLFAIFKSNPITDSVRVTIDDGSIRFVMKRDKFSDLIGTLCSTQMKILVEEAMKEFGETYLLDRSQNKLIHLTPSQIKGMDLKKIRDETIAREKEKSTSSLLLFNYDKNIKNTYDSLVNSLLKRKKK